MLHLLLAEKHQQILLKNAESRPARKIYVIISSLSHTAHLFEAVRHSPQGFKRRPPFKQSKFMPRDQKPRYVPWKHLSQRQSSSSSSTCHKSGRQGHFAWDFRASIYMIKIYYKNSEFRIKSHTVTVFLSTSNTAIENSIVLVTSMIQSSEVALLYIAWAQLYSPQKISFPASTTKWNICHVTTIASWRTSTFKERKATVLLLGNFSINCREAIYAPDDPRNMISYRDLRANQIHISTALEKGKEPLELRQKRRFFGTAYAAVDGLYEIAIKAISLSFGMKNRFAWLHGREVLVR